MGLVLAFGVVAGLPGPVIAEGSTQRAFTAVADARGTQLRYGIPGFLIVDNYVDAGAPVSQAVFSTDGSSTAFASNPYPGATVVGYPGLVAFGTGGTAPPGYPLYAAAAHPTNPEQTVSDPGGTYVLKAAASETAASGDAVVSLLSNEGQTLGQLRSVTAITVAEGDTRIEARSISRSVTLGPLAIARVESSSITHLRSGEPEPASETALWVEGAKAGDVSFSYGPAGFTVAKHGLPVPSGQALSALNEALGPAGLSVRFTEGQAVPGGATAGTFEVTSRADVPGAGQGTFVAAFGGATTLLSFGGETPLVPELPLPSDVTPVAGPAVPFPNETPVAAEASGTSSASVLSPHAGGDTAGSAFAEGATAADSGDGPGETQPALAEPASQPERPGAIPPWLFAASGATTALAALTLVAVLALFALLAGLVIAPRKSWTS